MQYFLGAIIFLFGSALGSFVLVIANRYNTGLSSFRGRSVCFSCNAELQKKDLIPIFSFLFLKGKCRYCRSKIPMSVFATEVVMGLLSLLVAVKIGIFDNFQFSIFNFQIIFNFLILISIFAVILLISIYDLKHFIIPDSFLFFLFIFSFLYLLISNLPIFQSFLSSLILALPFLLIFLISKGAWFGFGDVKLAAFLGLFLGFPKIVVALYVAFLTGAFVSLILIVLGKKKLRGSTVPFGPFMVIGTILTFFYGDALVSYLFLYLAI